MGIDPCEANTCKESVNCIENCSDCTAIHFDGSGNQVCVDKGMKKMPKDEIGIELENKVEKVKDEAEIEVEKDVTDKVEEVKDEPETEVKKGKTEADSQLEDGSMTEASASVDEASASVALPLWWVSVIYATFYFDLL